MGLRGRRRTHPPRETATALLAGLSLPDSLIPRLTILPFTRSPQQSPAMQRYNSENAFILHFEALELGNDFHYNVRTKYQYEAMKV